MIPGSFLIALILNKLHIKCKSTEKHAADILLDSPFNNVRIVDESVFQEARERSPTFAKRISCNAKCTLYSRLVSGI